MSILKTIADFDTQLLNAVAIGDTTATLVSVTDDDGVTASTGTYGLTIDSGQSSKEYFLCTLTGVNLTNIKSISRQGAETTGFSKNHRRGAKVTITDWASLKKIANLLDGTDNFPSSVNLGYDGSPTGLTGNQFATVAYVLSVVTGGTVTYDSQTISNQTAGESVTLNDVLYFKESDQKWYEADADLTATFDELQLAITKTTAVTNGTIQLVSSGSIGGFSGLTAGAKYYLSNTAGAITTTPGTNSVFIGWALNTTTLLFNPVLKTLPTQKEKDAMAGGSTFGTPASTNKFITEDYLSSASGLPVRTEYTNTATNRGSSTTQFDVSNPAGTTYRYTWDSTGTDPLISAATMPIGSLAYISGSNLNASNKGLFLVTGSGTDYFEVTNASGVVETNKTLGTGFLLTNAVANGTWTKPSKLKYIEVEVVGGGVDGSASSVGGITGAGGSSGAYSMKRIPAASLAATEYFIIGAKGLPSVFGLTSPVVSTGASLSHYTNFAGEPGVATGGTINIDGEGGGGGPNVTNINSQGGNGGSTKLGRGGKGGYRDNLGNALPGNSGTGYGSGGGGGSTLNSTTTSAGVGRQGVVVITEYYL